MRGRVRRGQVGAVAPAGMRLSLGLQLRPLPSTLWHMSTHAHTEHFLLHRAKSRELTMPLREAVCFLDLSSPPLSLLLSPPVSFPVPPLFPFPFLSPSSRFPEGPSRSSPSSQHSSAKAIRDQDQWVSKMWFPWQQLPWRLSPH